MRNMETRFKTIDQILKEDEDTDCPIPLEVIPDYMGINLCAVDGISWTRQADGQLVSATIHFIPGSDHERSAKEEPVEPAPAYDPTATDPPVGPRKKTFLERLRGAVVSAIEDYLDEQQRPRGAS